MSIILLQPLEGAELLEESLQSLEGVELLEEGLQPL